MSLRSEIFEQADVAARNIEQNWDAVQKVAEVIRQREIDYIFLSARGTSDHAGLYAKYLWGAYNRLPIALAAPSLFSIYNSPPRLERSLVLGISQSGQSPDIVSVLTEANRQGALTMAIANCTDSPMGDAADLVLDALAGPEKAVAATKSYTAQLTVIALLSAALSGDMERYEQIKKLPGYIEAVLKQEAVIAQFAQRYRYMTQCVICGRGFNYATAFEWSLKLKEMCYVVSEPYSSADFRHGPIAIVDQGFPVFAVMPDGKVFDDLMSLVKNLKYDHKVDLLVISNREEALELADVALSLPAGMPEWLSPIVSIVSGQLFTYHLTQVKGYDTESPRGLNKVTKTT